MNEEETNNVVYVDFKPGEWGVEIDTKTYINPEDRPWLVIDIDDPKNSLDYCVFFNDSNTLFFFPVPVNDA